MLWKFLCLLFWLEKCKSWKCKTCEFALPEISRVLEISGVEISGVPEISIVRSFLREEKSRAFAGFEISEVSEISTLEISVEISKVLVCTSVVKIDDR